LEVILFKKLLGEAFAGCERCQNLSRKVSKELGSGSTVGRSSKIL